MFKKMLCSFFVIFIGTAALAAPNVDGIQVYQKNLQSSPTHKQKLADDISRYRNADNLWDVLREEFVLPHYEDNPAVQEKIQWFLNNQGFLLRSATRAAPYMYYILQQVKRRHLPAELVLLPIIESGYNPFSRSPVGAVGIWQLMPSTANGLGVKQDGWFDGRRDVIASTRGALNYLAYLQSFFEGNWLFAIGAYNTGEGNILSAIKRNIRDGRDTDFWSLPVAQETRDYVPMLLALATIISHPDQYPIYFPPVRNAPYLAQVEANPQVSLKYAAMLAGLSYTRIQQLNPGFKSPSKSLSSAYKFVLPIENVDQFTQNLSRTPLSKQISLPRYRIKTRDTLVSVARKFKTTTTAMMHRNKYKLQPGDTIYMVRAHDTMASVTKRFKISSQLLDAANNLRGKSLVPGKQIIIPTHAGAVQAVASSNDTALQPGDTIYMVRRGDTIDKIAARFKTTPAALRVANLVDDRSLMEGERLVVPTHLRG